jgi:arsenate reductase
MDIKIYHNPRCSKSRRTLELIRDRGIEPVIVEYLDNPPDTEDVLRLAALLNVAVADLLRTGEDEFKAADDALALDDDAAVAEWLAAHPKVLERPIVVDEASARAAMGRPPENVLALLGK